jgi:Fe2+ transport system protein B
MMNIDDEYVPWLSAAARHQSEQEIRKYNEKQEKAIKDKELAILMKERQRKEEEQLKERKKREEEQARIEELFFNKQLLKLKQKHRKKEQKANNQQYKAESDFRNRFESDTNDFFNPHLKYQPYNRHSPSKALAYILLLAGLFSVGAICYVVYQFVNSLHFDLTQKGLEKSQGTPKLIEINSKTTECARHYTLNQCSTIIDNVPHMRGICGEWLDCMSKDPKGVQK